MGIKMQICIHRLFSVEDSKSRFQTSRMDQALKAKQTPTAISTMAHWVELRAEKSANMCGSP
jgi:hypothetical protein